VAQRRHYGPVPSWKSPADDARQSSEIKTHEQCEDVSIQISNSERIRILLVDDHAIIREGLRTLLAEYDNVEVIGEAQNGQDAIALTKVLDPSVIVMDINMPIMNGIEATEIIKSQNPSVSIVGISANGGEHANAILTAGATAFVNKSSAAESLYAAIVETIIPKSADTN
jgi:DNA-binding NarL/FixJ family response regulator